ncbi:unimolecular spanin [Escherichia phage vB_EcoS_011D2]|uniref:Unimolecular spanin n=1 Tax=Escherichia phage vB_EcoS_011D2 TaxID=2743843 RepID=A0A7D7IKY3_9CAUD|nr:unimolecular spanin [Escherichia phage vB_EcoS_011D2]WFS70166.1 U-spanin [Salmonella phage KKP 3830]
MKRKLLAIMMCIALSGCSASSVLPGLIGSKPDITAQAGAENVKQTVGVTAKQDTSSKQETTFKESAVGQVDTSNKKQVSTSSIKADNITAERIEIRNNDGLNVQAIAMGILMFIAGMLAGWTLKRNKAA